MFTSLARWIARALGTPGAFLAALIICVLWLVVAPLVGQGLTWKGLLLTNLPTVATLLMVFLVQHTQNHHNDVIQIKLDELIRAIEGAHNVMVHLEELSPEELNKVKARYQALAERVKASAGSGAADTSTPKIDP